MKVARFLFAFLLVSGLLVTKLDRLGRSELLDLFERIGKVGAASSRRSVCNRRQGELKGGAAGQVCALHVVTDHAGPAPTRRHRMAVRIGQGDLLVR